MAGHLSTAGEVAKKCLEEFPNAGLRTLSRKLRTEEPKLFPSIENARHILRYLTGRKGAQMRHAMGKDHKNVLRPLPTAENPLSLPDSEPQVETVYYIPSQYERMLVLADCHIPYHDIQSLTLAIQYGIENGADSVYLNGDTIDFYQLSRFCKDPRQRSAEGELEAVKAFFDTLNDKLPKAKIFFKVGNHDARLELYLRTNAPALIGVAEFELKVLLGFYERGIIQVSKTQRAKWDELNIIHGMEYQQGILSPVNPARGIFMKAKAATLVSHGHRSSEHTEKTLNDKMITCWSTGCLCDLHPEYAPFNQWNHGFSFLERDKEAGFRVTNKRIWDGKVV